jgi:hypothetical protein
MRRLVLGLTLAFAILVLMVSPVLAAGAPQAARMLSAADLEFLAALAAPAPTLAAQRPIVGKALCTATANCGTGGTISCSSNVSATSCSATDQNCAVHQRGSVTCNGSTTQCPNACPCSLDCTADRAGCVDSCSPCIAIFTCSLATCTESCRCKILGCPQ